MSTDLDRQRFEAWFLSSRHSKGVAHRAAMFARREDGTYDADHTQRHWWTWQNACQSVQAAQQRTDTGVTA